MNRLFFATLLFVIASSPGFSQPNNHPLKPSASPSEVRQPVIRGVRLGMTADELLAVVHDANDIKAGVEKSKGFPSFGYIRVSLQPADDTARERLKGTAEFAVNFFDGHIYSIQVRYPPYPEGVYWNDVDVLVAKVAEAINLPDVRSWVAETTDGNTKLFTGNGFVVRVSIRDGGSIEIRDLGVDLQGLLRQRTIAYQEEKRKAFKP
jgi:hypothetical protein